MHSSPQIVDFGEQLSDWRTARNRFNFLKYITCARAICNVNHMPFTIMTDMNEATRLLCWDGIVGTLSLYLHQCHHLLQRTQLPHNRGRSLRSVFWTNNRVIETLTPPERVYEHELVTFFRQILGNRIANDFFNLTLYHKGAWTHQIADIDIRVVVLTASTYQKQR